MQVHIAQETLKQIDNAIYRDQGAAYRGWLGKVLPTMKDAYRTDEDGHRTHMGASLIGGECARAIWYNFRWTTRPKFSGRITRLFNRGHLEEARFIACLLVIGCQIYQQDSNGNQFRISHANGHFGGSGDGVVTGLPELPSEQPVLSEFKTHGEKSFIELAGSNWQKFMDHLLDPNKPAVPFNGQGLRSAKFEHYVQMQVYMRKMGIAVGLYMAVNKNTDSIYAELIHIDAEIADQFLDRGNSLIYMKDPPKKINESPGFFKCAWCDHKPVCHLKSTPDRNCRTCIYSSPTESEGQWYCAKHEEIIPKETQLVGCHLYEMDKTYK